MDKFCVFYGISVLIKIFIKILTSSHLDLIFHVFNVFQLFIPVYY